MMQSSAANHKQTTPSCRRRRTLEDVGPTYQPPNQTHRSIQDRVNRVARILSLVKHDSSSPVEVEESPIAVGVTLTNTTHRKHLQDLDDSFRSDTPKNYRGDNEDPEIAMEEPAITPRVVEHLDTTTLSSKKEGRVTTTTPLPPTTMTSTTTRPLGRRRRKFPNHHSRPGAIRIPGIHSSSDDQDTPPSSFVEINNNSLSPTTTTTSPEEAPRQKSILAIAAEVVEEGEMDEEERQRIREELQQELKEQMISEAVQADIIVAAVDDDHYSVKRWRNWLVGACLVIVVAAFLIGFLAGTTSDDAPPPSTSTVAPTLPGGNQDCEAAIGPLEPGTVIRGSTNISSEETLIMECGTVVKSGKGVWYQVVGDGDLLRAQTCSSFTEFDTQLAVFTGSCDNLACVDGNDQFCGDQSSVTWPASNGTTYFLLVQGFLTEAGSFELTVESAGPITIDNDVCDNATAVQIEDDEVVTILGSTVGATVASVDSCGGVSSTAPGVWYRVTGSDTSFRASTCNVAATETDFDTKISVFAGSCGSLECVAGNDDACGTQSIVHWNSDYGADYFILVHGFGSRSGAFRLDISSGPSREVSLTASPTYIDGQTPPPEPTGPPFVPTPPSYPPVSNDHCESAVFINSPSDFAAIVGTTLGATIGAGFDDCGGSSSPGVWYALDGNNANITVSTCNDGEFVDTDFDTQLRVFAGSCEHLVCVDSNDNSCWDQSRVTWSSSPGQRYYIYVSGADDNDAGNFRLQFSSDIENDQCEGAIEMVLGSTNNLFSVVSSTLGASPEADLEACSSITNTAPGIWYTLFGQDRRVSATTCNGEGSSVTTYDTKISVFRGSCEQLECVTGNDDSCGLQSAVDWLAEEGEQYFMLIHGFASRVGTFRLNATELAS